MNTSVIYARVSSREQEREGYSIPAQLKLLHEYARKLGLRVVHEFVDIESAKNPGRREFGNMLSFLENDEHCRIILVEKTDRLYRNRTDALRVEQLEQDRDVQIHLVKESTIAIEWKRQASGPGADLDDATTRLPQRGQECVYHG